MGLKAVRQPINKAPKMLSPSHEAVQDMLDEASRAIAVNMRRRCRKHLLISKDIERATNIDQPSISRLMNGKMSGYRVGSAALAVLYQIASIAVALNMTLPQLLRLPPDSENDDVTSRLTAYWDRKKAREKGTRKQRAALSAAIKARNLLLTQSGLSPLVSDRSPRSPPVSRKERSAARAASE